MAALTDSRDPYSPDIPRAAPSSKTSCSAFPLAGTQFVVCRAGAGLSDCLARASHGRLSFRDLGAQVHLSPNATAERVRRLQSANIICGFHAEIDHTKLGLSLQAYIDVQLRPGTSAQSFEAVATKLPGIINAAILTGALDFRLRVACQGQSDLVQLIETLRSRAGVQETNTTVILKELAANTYVRSI